MFFAEVAFPVGDPFFDGHGRCAGEAEAVEVILHEDIIGDEPGGCFAPGLFEVFLGDVVGEPGFAIFCGDGEEDAGGLCLSRCGKLNAGRGILSTDDRWVHGVRVVNLIRKSEKEIVGGSWLTAALLQ